MIRDTLFSSSQWQQRFKGFLSVCIFGTALAVAGQGQLFGQFGTPGGQGPNAGGGGNWGQFTNNFDNQAFDGGAGGATAADFQQLMDLIQSVIGDNWEADGGTDTMTPYAQGVWIDSAGAIKTKISDVEFPRPTFASRVQISEPIAMPELGPWQAGTDLRWISLTQLEQALNQRLDSGKKASLSMELLGGLTRVEYVVWDADVQQWFLGGPAGKLGISPVGELISLDSGLPPVLLEDLLAIAGPVLSGTRAIGCTIDPDAKRLAATQTFLAKSSTQKLLRDRPDRWADEVAETLGEQRTILFGLPEDSPTGLALLLADRDMKEIGLGTKTSGLPIEDYMTLAEKLDVDNNGTLVRWWFAYNDFEIVSNTSKTAFRIPADTVQVLSEQQFSDRSGNRFATGQRDAAADTFAKSFTAFFPELAAKRPMYGRLQHIFDLTIAMRIIRELSSNRRFVDELGDRPTSLRGLAEERLAPHLDVAPRSFPSLALFRRNSSRTMVGIVSGGVTVDVKSGLRNTRVDDERLSRTTELSSFEGAAESWWE